MFRLLNLAIALIAVLGSVSASAETLVISSWGGAYEESQRRAYAEPFIAKNPGLEIIWEAKSNDALANLRAQVEANNITWDLVDLLPDAAQIACDEGMLEPINHNTQLAQGDDGSLPTDDFFAGALGDCFVATIIYSNVVAFNTEIFTGAQPKTMIDVFDTKNFPGKRAFEKTPLSLMEWALIADGVPLAKVYATLETRKGVQRALRKLDTIKDSIVWWEVGAQAPQLLADKEVAFASAYNGRIFNAQVNEKQPFQIIWDAQVLEFDGWGIPKGKASSQVLEFLKFSTDSQRLADQAKYISYSPARKSSALLVSTHADTGVDMQPHMPTAPVNVANALPKDIEFWTDNLDELRQVFNAWLNR